MSAQPELHSKEEIYRMVVHAVNQALWSLDFVLLRAVAHSIWEHLNLSDEFLSKVRKFEVLDENVVIYVTDPKSIR